MVICEKKKASVRVYTRQAEPGIYPDGLARSVHFSVKWENGAEEPLNAGYGILFAEGTIRENNTICPKCVADARIAAREDGTFAVTARRVEEDGSEDEESRGKLLLWLTKDFISFEACGLVEEKEAQRERELPRADTAWAAEDVCARALLYWGKLEQTGMRLPERAAVSCAQELEDVRALAVYSDGSVAEKRVDWDGSSVDFETEGEYLVKGRVKSPRYPFPLDRGWGDPVVFFWEGKYYYIATNDNRDDVGFYVREADRPEELFEEDRKRHIILDYDEEREFIQTFWAPEFHEIGGRLYILFAVGPKKWGPQCWMMCLKEGGRITDAGSWEEPVRVRKKDGSFLCEKGITLDMTYIRAEKASYVVWSYRDGINSPLDTGSMLYIAQIDEKEPWKLMSDPVLLSRPLYGWENTEGTINNEGPHAFVRDGKVYLTYSGGSANGYSYVLGLLSADASADLLDPANWEKSLTPVLSFYSVEGQYGPGHNSFFVDPEGNLMIAYHGETAIDGHLRCPGIRRVHFDIQGRPRFDLSADRDLKPELSDVELRITVKPDKGDKA